MLLQVMHVSMQLLLAQQVSALLPMLRLAGTVSEEPALQFFKVTRSSLPFFLLKTRMDVLQSTRCKDPAELPQLEAAHRYVRTRRHAQTVSRTVCVAGLRCLGPDEKCFQQRRASHMAGYGCGTSVQGCQCAWQRGVSTRISQQRMHEGCAAVAAEERHSRCLRGPRPPSEFIVYAS